MPLPKAHAMIDSTKLPTHLASIARRLHVVGFEASADTFLATSYLTEGLLKTIALALLAGVRRASPAIFYKLEYDIVRADGLGSWVQAIQTCTGQSYAGYLDSDLQALVAWLTKRRTQADDVWAQQATKHCSDILNQLGAADTATPPRFNVLHLLRQLVQIRNKTKAHGAVGPDFFAIANGPYVEATSLFLHNCPATTWEWYHLANRSDRDNVRAIALTGTTPAHVRAEAANALRPTASGMHFRTHDRGHLFHCGELIRTNLECSAFGFPNGGYSTSGSAEFVDYASGKTENVQLPAYLQTPAPLPPSATEGAGALDIYSNIFGNLPPRPDRYVARSTLEAELATRLRDRNHPIITLHGRGGVGKTSLALQLAHVLSEEALPQFEHIIWLSARDVELKPSGTMEVRRAVANLDSVCQRVSTLLDTEPNAESLAQLLRDPAYVGSRGILLIFDNFETLDDPREVHRFLDDHSHVPNKVLITSRERAFKGDYPIEVGGMEREEAQRLIEQEAEALGISTIVGDAGIDEIFEYTDGHAYIMRVLLGEVAKENKWVPLKSLVPRRSDLLNVVFERSFNKLTPEGRWCFLSISCWRSLITELALLVVLGLRGFDAEKGLEECVRLSLLTRHELPDGTCCYDAPELARLFGKKKLEGDPDRLLILEDLELLREFGPLQETAARTSSAGAVVDRFVLTCIERAPGAKLEVRDRLDAALSGVAELWPAAWLGVARFRQETGQSPDAIAYALRRAVEENPDDKATWLARAEFASRQNDAATRIASLVSAVETDPTDVELVREVAFQLCQYIDAHKNEIPVARRGVYLASVRTHMERLAKRLDATGLSRLAWLFLLENNQDGGWKYADLGLSKDSTNHYCLQSMQRLDRRGYSPQRD